MDFDTRGKLAIYRHFAETGRAPTAETVAVRLEVDPEAVRRSYGDLRAARVLLLEPDGMSIRMAASPSTPGTAGRG